MDLAKQNAPGIESHAAPEYRDALHPTEGETREPPFLLDLFENGVMDQIEKLRYYRKRGDVPFPQSPQQLGGVECGKINYAGSRDQGQQQVCHLGKNVEERQDSQNGVRWTYMRPRKNGFSLAQEIGVGEHHAFGVGGGARSVEERRQVVRPARHGA